MGLECSKSVEVLGNGRVWLAKGWWGWLGKGQGLARKGVGLMYGAVSLWCWLGKGRGWSAVSLWRCC